MTRTQKRTMAIVARALMVLSLLVVFAIVCNAEIGYESPPENVAPAATQPNYFVEESTTQPLSPQALEQPGADRYARLAVSRAGSGTG